MARTVDFAKKLRKIAASLEELATAIEGNRPIVTAALGT